MSRLRYADESLDDAADRVYGERAQRELDDRREAREALAKSYLGECHLTAEQKVDLTARLADALDDAARDFIAEERLPS